MPNYQDRAPRSDLNLPIRFFSRSGLATGYCMNVSETGMRAEFDGIIDVWLEGDISFVIEGQQLSIKARVARVDGRDAGLWFRIESDEDKLTIGKLLKLAEASKGGLPKED